MLLDDCAELPQAVVICGAGTEEANGTYKASRNQYCGGPIYEHINRGTDFKISREPHASAKTGRIKHGWLLGQQKSPLYGVPTEALTIPMSGWKKFNGAAPVPTVKVHSTLTEVFYGTADALKNVGDAAVDQEEWQAAVDAFSKALDTLKHVGEHTSEQISDRAAALLSRRARVNLRLDQHQLALRDAMVALGFVRSLSSMEALLKQAAKQVGVPDDAVQRLFELVGGDHLLDKNAPLVFRSVDRWLNGALPALCADGKDAILPDLVHMDVDRYLDGMDDVKRMNVIKCQLAGLMPPYGGDAEIHSAENCLALMRRWEHVLSGENFQHRRAELWNCKLSYILRLHKTQELVADCLQDVLLSRGYAPGRPGLALCVKQMQPFWSTDKVCACKALDLEELADISLADLE